MTFKPNNNIINLTKWGFVVMKEIRELYFHIIAIIVVVIISIFIWPNNKDVKVVSGNLGVQLSFEGYKEISVLSNEEYNKAIPSNIYIKNISKDKNNYNIYYKYAKDSTLDFNNISISLNDKIYNLKDIESYQDEYNYYFKLDNYSLESYESEIITTRIWTNQSEGVVRSTFVAL